MSSRHLIVHGRVQGVFYRASAQERATDLGVAGWVRNRTDGTVEMVLEGDDAAVEAMIAWAHEGPARAAVSAVDVSETEPTGRSGFSQG